MKEWKMHNMENDRICTPRKMKEKSQLEKDRMGNEHQEMVENHTGKMTEKAHLEYGGMENARHGK